ncbi:MAG: hypothetical protein GF333_02120 [Candidatus Omnitrophica bacterium]|nr:hypothetical protein [Candidatus Omnitrophota bacterium]
MLYKFSTLLARAILILGFDLKIRGRESIPPAGPFLLVANHESNFDPPVLAAACPREIYFLAKEELFTVHPLLGIYLRKVNALPLRRGRTDISSVRSAVKVLKNDPLLVFPQGRRGVSLAEVKPGVGFLHRKTRVPVVAAAVKGTGQVLPRGAKMVRRGKISVRFSPVGALHPGDSAEEAAGKIMSRIIALLDAPESV